MTTKPFKIAFVGTACVGKTTLLSEIKKQFPSVEIVEEAARVIMEKNLELQAMVTPFQEQTDIQALALKLEKEAQKKDLKIILCDRSVIDAVVYLRVIPKFKTDANNLFIKVKDWIPTYDKFYLLDPTDVPYQIDRIRKETLDDRQKLHDAFIDFFAETEIPYEMLSGTLEERIEKVRKIIPTNLI